MHRGIRQQRLWSGFWKALISSRLFLRGGEGFGAIGELYGQGRTIVKDSRREEEFAHFVGFLW